MNRLELKALRLQLFLDVVEAADLIGKFRPRTWEYIESGKYEIYDDVLETCSKIMQDRKSLYSALENSKELPLYGTMANYLRDFPNRDKLDWKMYQSVVTQLFLEEKIRLV